MGLPRNGSGPIALGVGILDDISYYTRGGKLVQEGTASHWQRAGLFRNGVVHGTDSSYYLD